MAAQRHVYQCILRLEHTLRLRVPNFDAPQDSDCVIKIVFSLAAARGDPAADRSMEQRSLICSALKATSERNCEIKF